DLEAVDVRSAVAAIRQAKLSAFGSLAKGKRRHLAIYNSDESLADYLSFQEGTPQRYPCWGGRRLYYLDFRLDLYQCFTLPRRYGNLLELGKLVDYEDGTCDRCTQQAFRDFGPLYAGVEAVTSAASQLAGGHPVEAARTLAAPEARGGLRAV